MGAERSRQPKRKVEGVKGQNLFGSGYAGLGPSGFWSNIDLVAPRYLAYFDIQGGAQPLKSR
jgi:hypothetical protein